MVALSGLLPGYVPRSISNYLTQRPDDPVTEHGLYARLQAFDDYNELGGRKGLREVMGVKWLRVLELTLDT